ncbi:hypothetical protein GCK32_004954 [Trichostrongylus colubriformis]|uniref:Uncharacterized protein n=1 Tax=Trichostrongylus colubriformis TaxID=6319 RepID=A0AAN8FSQ8_TRICO
MKAPDSDTLQIRLLDVVFFNKTAGPGKGLIVHRAQVNHNLATIAGQATIAYAGGLHNTEIGLYIMVLRIGDSRRNENPISNVVLKTVKLADGTVVSPAPGSGYDFGYMYSLGPFGLKINIEAVTDAGDVRQYKEYAPLGCAATSRWFGNEGYYKLDIATGEWHNIYYNPVAADYYY